MFFGREGAGVLIMAKDTGRVLALKRSDNVQQPRTWGVPGGRMEEGENPYEAAMREVQEEIDYQGEISDAYPLKTFEAADGKFKFNNWMVVVPEEFVPKLDHETENFQWVLPDEWPEPRHFGMKTILDDPESRNVVQEISHSAINPDAAQVRAGKTHPPVLYHLIHGDIRGDTLNPSQANPQDPCPYVYATSNLREALPYMTPNGTRIVNAQIPGSEDILTIIPDRENFMKTGKMQGLLLRFQGDGFKQKIVDGEPTTQWVSENPVPIRKDEAFAEMKNIEDAMFFGLHVLFTPGPIYGDGNEESFRKIEEITSHPSFPHNLPDEIRKGNLVYENANAAYADKGIKPSPFFEAKDDERRRTPSTPFTHS